METISGLLQGGMKLYPVWTYGSRSVQRRLILPLLRGIAQLTRVVYAGTMKHVLVVDDSRIMRNIVKNTFDLLKFPSTYLEAANGDDALKLLLSHPVDLVLLDWNMPGLSGIDFLKTVRGMDQYKRVPIVMVTSEAGRLNIVEAIKAGATAYITKPIDEKFFKEKISKILGL